MEIQADLEEAVLRIMLTEVLVQVQQDKVIMAEMEKIIHRTRLVVEAVLAKLVAMVILLLPVGMVDQVRQLVLPVHPHIMQVEVEVVMERLLGIHQVVLVEVVQVVQEQATFQ
jgi:predicted Co/Zn/Cd cation transporter (cation efflux family)